MVSEEELKKEINVGIDYANPNRVWKAVGDLIDLKVKAGQLAEREKCLKIIEPREFNENITKIMNKNGFVTYDDNECIWVCCNIIKNYLKEELTKKVNLPTSSDTNPSDLHSE